jgi:ABC-type multidrug transport system ATPase subunit
MALSDDLHKLADAVATRASFEGDQMTRPLLAIEGSSKPDPGARVLVQGTTHVIHQDLGLIPQLDTVENLDLGRRHGLGTPLPTRRRAESEHARELLRQFDAAFDVTVPVGRLTPAESAIVAIARALDGWERPEGLLILDEPTAALHSDEVRGLFTAVRRAAASGAAVIFVSHRLDEVLDLADRVVVLRDGRLVADSPVAGLDHAELVRLIVGAALEQAGPRERRDAGELALRRRGERGAERDELDRRAQAHGVLLPAADPNQFLQQMKQLRDAKIPVSANGIVQPARYGLQADFINDDTNALAGKLLAEWAVANGRGGTVAIYGVPELSFSGQLQKAFDREMALNCPSCDVRHVDIPVAEIGKSAPSRVVSDLQSYPNTKVAVFATAEAGTGLPAALKSAQLKVKLVGWGPPPRSSATSSRASGTRRSAWTGSR